MLTEEGTALGIRLAIGGGVVLVIVVFSNLLVGFWQKYLPSMLITLVKFQLYVIIPATAVSATIFGMYLESRYEKFEDLKESFWDKYHQITAGVKGIRKKM